MANTAAIRVAIALVLESDSKLMELAGAPYFDVSEDATEAVTPVCIFGKMAGVPEPAFQGLGPEDERWQVKGVGPVEIAEEIDQRCRELLNEAEISIEGRTLQYLRVASDISYTEIVDGERYQHVGAVYKVISEGN